MSKKYWFVFLVFIFCPSKVKAEQFLYLPFYTQSPRVTCNFCCYQLNNRCHGGIDYGFSDGTKILAAAEGEVIKTKNGKQNSDQIKSGYGNYIKIRHDNGYVTTYAHLQIDSILVNEGDIVTPETIIALSDNSGWSSGPHLHFEIRDKTNRRIDPYPNYPNCGPNSLWLTCPPTPYHNGDPLETDNDGDGYSEEQGDCNDDDKIVYPGAPELCNGQDDDCDDEIDEEPDASYHCRDDADCSQNWCENNICQTIYYHDECADDDYCTTDLCTMLGCRNITRDEDGDDHIDPNCGGDDCDDEDRNTYPGAPEICDEKDNDCDSMVDEGINLRDDTNNCGECGNTCPQIEHTTIVCRNYQCEIIGCDPGWQDIDGLVDNGCESNRLKSRFDICEFDEECQSGLACYTDQRSDFYPRKICTSQCGISDSCRTCEYCMGGGCMPGIGSRSGSQPRGCPCLENGQKDCAYGLWCGDPDNDGYPSMDCYNYNGGCECDGG